jgi:G2/mitotic-specific cyclin 1/2
MVTRAKALGAIGGSNIQATTAAEGSQALQVQQQLPVKTTKPAGRDGKENAASNNNPNNNESTKPEKEAADWDDLDAEDNGDPLMVSEYIVEIIEYMKKIEVSASTQLTMYYSNL